MKITAELEGRGLLEAKFDKLVESLGAERMEPILMEGANSIRNAVRLNAPYLTGRLRMFINTFFMGGLGDNPRSVIVKVQQRAKPPTEAPHAHLIELGTVKMRARPFFRPAWDANRNRVYIYIITKIRKLVESVK